MAEQGSYPLNGRTLQPTDNVTGVVSGATADIPLSILSLFLVATGGAGLSGSTSLRSTIAPSFIGQPFFDTTLGFMVWAKQLLPAIWVDAAGVQV